VRLGGRRLVAHRVIQALGAAIGLFAFVSILLPWHEQRDSGLGEALGCAFMPDCHVDQTPREVRLASPPDAVHSGLEHGGLAMLALMVLLAGGRAISWVRPRLWFSALTGLSTIAAAGALLLSGFMPHLFDLTTPLLGTALRDAAIAALAAVGVLDILSAGFLFIGQRLDDAETRIPAPER
jgi:hypothetical protein